MVYPLMQSGLAGLLPGIDQHKYGTDHAIAMRFTNYPSILLSTILSIALAHQVAAQPTPTKSPASVSGKAAVAPTATVISPTSAKAVMTSALKPAAVVAGKHVQAALPKIEFLRDIAPILDRGGCSTAA